MEEKEMLAKTVEVLNASIATLSEKHKKEVDALNARMPLRNFPPVARHANETDTCPVRSADAGPARRGRHGSRARGLR